MTILIAILIIIFILSSFLAIKCLQLVTNPECSSKAEIREKEIGFGFGDTIASYENEWDREPFTIEADQATLQGEIIRNKNANNDKVAIIAHGHTVNRITSIKYAGLFYKAGFNLIIYDERHFGDSTGDYCTLGEREAKDLALIIRHAREVFGSDCKIVLHGESMGAATSLLVLQYEKPGLVVADCPFSDTRTLFKEWIRNNLHIPWITILPLIEFYGKVLYKYHVKETSPIAAVKQSDVPICFMHGDEDKLIDCHHSEMMYEQCRNGLSELHLFPGAAHARSVVVDPEGYEKILLTFLKKCEML